MSLLGAALAATLLLGDPAPSATLAERVAAEHARNAALPPFIPTALPRVAPSVPPVKRDDCDQCRLQRLRRPGIASDHPDYPDLLFTLVAEFAAKQHYHTARAAELDAELAHTREPRHVDQLRARRARVQAQAREAAEQMVKLLKILVSTPSYRSFRRLEEALYLYAQELHALGREVEGKDAALRLIQDHRDSPYASRAYALFGLYYLGKSKLTDTRDLFNHVLTGPTRDIDAIAHLGLGWTHLRSEAGEPPRPDLALAAFIRAIEASSRDDEILRSAHDGLVHAFAAAGRPGRAAALFTRLAAVPQPVDRRDITLLERLALAYFARGQHRESAEIYRDLLRLHPRDPQACTWQTRILLTAVATRDRDAQRSEALRLATTWQTWRDESLHPKSLRERCRDDARDALIDLAHQRQPADPALCAAHRDLFPDDPPLCAATP